MKKVALLVLVLLVGVINLNARDMSGKIGMGIGWSGIGLTTQGQPIIIAPDLAGVAIGLSSNMVLHPAFNLYVQSEDEQTTTTISAGLFLDYIFMSHDKTNLSLSGGFSFGVESPPEGENTTEIGLLAGVGLEHFISDYFSIRTTLQQEFANRSIGDASNSTTYLGTQFLNLSLMWYY